MSYDLMTNYDACLTSSGHSAAEPYDVDQLV